MTIDKLSKTSARLPPDSLWIISAVTNSRTSVSGIRRIRFSNASRKGSPRFCCSYARWNSSDSGAGISLAINSSPVVNACPARTARPKRSMASGNCSSNKRNRRWRRMAITINGMTAARSPNRTAKTAMRPNSKEKRKNKPSQKH